MADKDTIDTTPHPDTPNDDTPDASAQDTGSTDSNSSYSLRNRKISPYCTNTMKKQKKKEHKIDDKVTIYTHPDTDTPDSDTNNNHSQDDGSTDSYLPYSSKNCKFSLYSTDTMKNQKKRENKIDDKVTIDTTTSPDAPGTDTPNASDQYNGSTDSNSPY